MNRVYSLAILRGLASLSILVFHYLKGTLDHELNADHILSRLGYYGVSVFYVLSGLTLTIVYKDKLKNNVDNINFLCKRILRIYPLMIAAMVLTIIINPPYSISTIFLNVTGLFGFFDYANYIGTGMWSIGNELVFYLFFPFLLYLFTKSFNSFKIVFLIGVIAFLLFSFFVINPQDDSWKDYINPINQFAFFLSGILIYKGLSTKIFNKPIFIGLLGLLAFGVFAFYPVSGDSEYLIFGFNRIVFSSCCILICIIFFKLNDFLNPKNFFIKPLIVLGEISYGIYLLHPLVAAYLNKLTSLFYEMPLTASIRIPIAVTVTIILSYFSYMYFEKRVSKYLYNFLRAPIINEQNHGKQSQNPYS